MAPGQRVPTSMAIACVIFVLVSVLLLRGKDQELLVHVVLLVTRVGVDKKSHHSQGPRRRSSAAARKSDFEPFPLPRVATERKTPPTPKGAGAEGI